MPLSQGRVWTRLREALSTASPSTWSEDLRALLVSSLCPLPRHGAGTQNLLFVPYHELNHKACSRPIFSSPLLSKQISFCFCFDFKRKTFWSKNCTLPHQRMSVFFGGGKKKKQQKNKAEQNHSETQLLRHKGAMPHWRPLQEHSHCMATGMATCNSLLSDSWPVLQQNSHFSPCPFCRASLSCWRHLLGSRAQHSRKPT